MRSYRSSIALALLVFMSLLGGTAQAREAGRGGGEHWGGHGPEGGDHQWRGPEGPRWRGEDMARWHGGRWFHGEHLGRFGWWWIVNDGWYGYPVPVYPYPDPYVPPSVAAPSTGYWYYCASANAYYPYVAQCPEGWTQVMPQSGP